MRTDTRGGCSCCTAGEFRLQRETRSSVSGAPIAKYYVPHLSLRADDDIRQSANTRESLVAARTATKLASHRSPARGPGAVVRVVLGLAAAAAAGNVAAVLLRHRQHYGEGQTTEAHLGGRHGIEFWVGWKCSR